MTFRKTLTATAVIALCASGALADGKLNIYAWADSIAPELLTKFTDETGIDIVFDSYNSNEDMLTKLQAGSSGFDLVMPSQHFVKIMIDEGLLEDIAAYDMPAFQQVNPKWHNEWWDEKNDYSIPFAYGSAGFTVNRDVYDGPVDSWEVFFKPTGALTNNVAAMGDPDEVVSAAQLYLGIEYCSEDPQEMKKVLDLLQEQKKDVVAYTSDNIANRIANGDVGAHFWWPAETLRARLNDGAPIEYAMPKEGLVGWLDSLVVPKGAKNIENAKTFINFVSEKENATVQYNYYATSSPVELDMETAKYTPENAPELFPTVPVVFARACSPAAQDLVTKVWEQ